MFCSQFYALNLCSKRSASLILLLFSFSCVILLRNISSKRSSTRHWGFAPTSKSEISLICFANSMILLGFASSTPPLAVRCSLFGRSSVIILLYFLKKVPKTVVGAIKSLLLEALIYFLLRKKVQFDGGSAPKPPPLRGL